MWFVLFFTTYLNIIFIFLKLNHGAVTNEYLIKRELKQLKLIGKRPGGDGELRDRLRDVHLDSDRRLPLFSFTPDTFSLYRLKYLNIHFLF